MRRASSYYLGCGLRLAGYWSVTAYHWYSLRTLQRRTFTKVWYVAATIQQDLSNKDYELVNTYI